MPNMPPGAGEGFANPAMLTTSQQLEGDEKDIFGEKLYTKIEQVEPELAGKITGMLLEMDRSDIMILLESPTALNAKIAEACETLRQ